MAAKLRIIINEDNDHYFKLDPRFMGEQPLRDYVLRYAEAGIDTISFCTSGQRCSYRSHILDAIWDSLEDGSKPDNVWSRNAEALFHAGIDPYAVWLDQCQRCHVHAWISTRMNDMHHTQMQKTDDSPFDGAAGHDRPPRLFQSIVEFHHEYSREHGVAWSGGGFIDGVTVRDVSVMTDGRKPAVVLIGIDADHRPENIVFENLSVNGSPVTDASGVVLDVADGIPPPRFV